MPPPEKKKSRIISLRDVAEEAGVSRMTASRALREGTQVSSELRAKVLAAAENLGYKTDQMVSQIMGSFAGQRQVDYRETIAVLWWPGRWALATLQDENYEVRTLRGLQIAAELHGCKLENISMTEDRPAQVMSRMLTARSIQGIILTPPRHYDQTAPDLDWDKFSVVSIGTTLHTPRFHRARVSHYNTMVLALQKLDQLGCKRPCLLVNEDLEKRMDRAYTAAFMAWNPKAASDRIWRKADMSERGLKTWIKARKPDVIIGDLAHWQPFLPEPYASKRFVALNVMDRTGDICGVLQNTELLAEQAVDLLMHARLRKQTGIPKSPTTTVNEGVWLSGKSFQPGQ